jgi:hypothetical protein
MTEVDAPNVFENLETLESQEAKGRERFLRTVEEDARMGRPEGFLYPNYIRTDPDNSDAIYADVTLQAPCLQLQAPWIPIPWNTVAVKEDEILRTKILQRMAEDPAIIPFPVYTPALFAVLCATPDRRILDKMDAMHQFQVDNYGHKSEGEIENKQTLRELHEVIMYDAQRELMEAKLEIMKGVSIPRYYCSARLLVSFKIDEMLIALTNGLLPRDQHEFFNKKLEAAAEDLESHILTAANQLYNVSLYNEHNWGLSDLVKQILDYGMVVDYERSLNIDLLCHALIRYNMALIKAHENWFFTMLDIPARFRFYHATEANMVPSPFGVSVTVLQTCKGTINALEKIRLCNDTFSWYRGEFIDNIKRTKFSEERISIRQVKIPQLCNVAVNIARRFVNDNCKGTMEWRSLMLNRGFSRNLEFTLPTHVEFISD